jgi:DNA-binding NtrC family response regulator
MNQDPIDASDRPSRPRLLLADDDATSRAALAAGLTGAGFDVDVAATAEEALERLSGAPRDVLVATASGPTLDGVALVARARQLHPTLGVVALTSRGAVEALRAGADHCVAAPVDVDELALVLGRVVEQCALRREAASLRERAAAAGAAPVVPGARLEDIERHAIMSTLGACAGSTHRAAAVLGVSVRMIQYRLREYRYGIRRDYGADHRGANGSAEQVRRLDG